LIATVEHPEPELPPIPGTPAPGSQRAVAAPQGPRKIGRWIVLGVAAAAAAAVGVYAQRERLWPAPVLADSTSVAVAVAPVAETLPTDFSLGPVVNPEDSAAALRFSVELVAANSLSGANSGLTSRGDPYPIPTVAPVLLGSAPTVW